MNALFQKNKVSPLNEEQNNEPGSTSTSFDVCVVGHSECTELLDWLQAALTLYTNPKLRCTRDATASAASYVVALSPHSWECEDVISALSRATSDKKRVGLLHLPENEKAYMCSSDVVQVGDVNSIRVDLGYLLYSVPKEFSNIFAECEVLSLRRESWVVKSVVMHLIDTIGFSRRKTNSHSELKPSSTSNDVLSDCIFEGTAYSTTDNELLGWYQIIAKFHDTTVDLEIDYLSQSFYSIASFNCKHSLNWSTSESKMWQSDGDKSWYSDARWNTNTDRVMSKCMGTYHSPSKTLILENTYINSSAKSVHEVARLTKRDFRYHYCLLGVSTEIADTAITFSNVIRERAQQSRKPRVAVLCDREPEPDADETICMHSAVVVIFVTPSVWQDTHVLRNAQVAKDSGAKFILISQADPRLTGHCVVSSVMSNAPSYLCNYDVLPFYRRNYEQNALLDHILLISGFKEAVIGDLNLSDMWKMGSADPALMETKLLSRIDEWGDTNELELLRSNRWIYYEGVAGRGGHVWGWYQIDCLFNDSKNEIAMLIHYQSRNTGSVPSYIKIASFDWDSNTNQFREKEGHWHGVRDEKTMNLSITNRYGDTITHTAMSYVHHFFLSHIQREATDLCAFVSSELRAVTMIGKKTRCWFDQKASQINKEGMYAGIEHSGAYVLFLSPSVWRSMYVMFELETAKMLKKPIILVHCTDKSTPSYVDIEKLMADAPPEHSQLLSECNVCLQYASEGDARIGFMYGLLHAGGYLDDMEPELKSIGQRCSSGFVEQHSIPHCNNGHEMEISDYAENGYEGGYVCNICRVQKTGERWFCKHCSDDMCFECIKRVD